MLKKEPHFKILLILFAGSLFLAVPGCHKTQPVCNRGYLTRFIDQYLKTLVTHDPSSLPLTKDVHYTEIKSIRRTI